MTITTLIVNSKDKVRGSNDDFTVQIPTNIENIHTVSLVALSVPQTNYTINTTNASFTLTTFPTIILPVYNTITITHGIYDPITLANELKTKLKQVDANFNVIYNETTLKYTITHPSIAFAFTFTDNPSLREMLGFTEDLNASFGLSLTSDIVAIILTPSIYYIRVRQFSNNIIRCSRLIQNATTFYIITGYTPPTVQFVDLRHRPQTITFKEQIKIAGNLDVEVVDEEGRKLYNLGNWTMLLEIHNNDDEK